MSGVFNSWPGPLVVLLTLAIGILLSTLPLAWIILLFSALVVLLLGLIQPLLVLALALIAAPFGALESVIFGGVSFDSGQILLLIALAAWIGRGLVRHQFRLPASPLTPPLLIFIAVGIISLIAAPDLLLGIKEVIKWIEVTAVMLMVTDLGSHLGSRRFQNGQFTQSYNVWWVVAMLMVAGITQAIIGIWQFMLRGDGPEHFLVLGRYYRAYGTFEQPNPFGGYMNLTALLAIGVLLGLFTRWFTQRREPSSQSEYSDLASSLRRAMVALTVLFVGIATTLALFFSWSRGAWIGFLSGLAVMALFWPRRLRYGLLLIGIATAAFLFLYRSDLLPPTISERISGFSQDLTLGDVRGVDINDENYAVLERLAYWQAALDMARDRPWLGVGFGNYSAAYGDYALVNWPDPLGHAHNYYLNTLAEIGFIGIGAYLFLWGAIFWQTWLSLADEFWPVRGVALGLLGIWTAITVHHSVDKLYVNNIYIHLGVLLGLLQLVSLHASSGVPVKDQAEEIR